jgi:hypothetical protein
MNVHNKDYLRKWRLWLSFLKIENKSKKGKAKRLVPPEKKAAPQECVKSRTRERSKVKPGLVRKDIRSSGSDNLQQGKEDAFTNSDQPRGKSKKSSLLHLTSTEKSI